MTLSDTIAILGIILSIISTFIAGFAIKQAYFIKNQELNHANYEDMKCWFEKTVHIMKELYLKFPDNSNKKALSETLVELSACIDLGRLFFKNQTDGDYKIDKPEVFRGRRVIVLDIIVMYFDIFFEGVQEDNQDILWSLQRAFISEMIMFLEKNRNSEKLVEYDYIDHNDIIEFKNLNNEQFREILLSKDIIKAVKERSITIENPKKATKKTAKKQLTKVKKQ